LEAVGQPQRSQEFGDSGNALGKKDQMTGNEFAAFLLALKKLQKALKS
jgi:hypothetical protein